MASCNSWNNNIIYMQLQIQFIINFFPDCHLNQMVSFIISESIKIVFY